jgi:hypothetical protein
MAEGIDSGQRPALNIMVESRLRSLYLMLATMGRVNHA